MRVSARTTNTVTEVVVTGIGHLAENPTCVAGSVDLPEHWPAGVCTHLACLDLSHLEGSIWCTEPALIPTPPTPPTPPT